MIREPMHTLPSLRFQAQSSRNGSLWVCILFHKLFDSLVQISQLLRIVMSNRFGDAF